MIAAAEALDSDADTLGMERVLRAIAREARRHDCRAIVVGVRGPDPHVLVLHPDGGILATRSARRLAEWLGY